MYDGSTYYERILAVELFEVAGMAVQDITIADALRRILEEVEASRSQLRQLQELIRGAAVNGTSPTLELVRSRDSARQAHVEQLSRAVRVGEDHGERYQLLQDETAHLLDPATAQTPVQQQRLEALQGSLLPSVGGYLQRLPSLRDELADLQAYLSGQLPNTALLHTLHAEWEKAADDLHEASHAEKKRRPPPGAAEATAQARRELQQAEAKLRHERMRIWRMATHFPELLAQEQLLRLGAIDGAAIQSLLVERELDQYSELQVIADHRSSRHRIFSAEFGTDSHGRSTACVLKEYELDAAGREWKRLVAEVEALRKLQHPHIVQVEAVFQPKNPPTPMPVAYVQLPFYANGDAASWRARLAPELWKRRRVLMQLAQALDHLHTHGYAHGDLKLENVLISSQETAHLADFEGVREQAPCATSLWVASVASSTFGVVTAKYIAPEMRSSEACAQPTAATDMYAFGVCSLLMCCDERDFTFSPPPTEQLQRWSTASASSKGGDHLPSFLDGLLDLDRPPATNLADALQRRMSAAEALRHPFLDTGAERQALAEQERLQRQHRWEAAERQRLLDEQEAVVKHAEAAVAQEHQRLGAAKAALLQRTAEAERGIREAAESASQLQDQKRRAEGELLQLSHNLAAQDARLKQLRDEEARRKQSAPGVVLWLELAENCVSEQAIRAFFDARQRRSNGHLRVASAVMVQKETALRAFKKSSTFNIDPLQAYQHAKGYGGCDTLLFHGCSQEAAANIEHEGLLLRYAAPGMLGKGLYGAPDPNKSKGYCKGGTNGNFMFICRFNLSGAQHAGPSTAHRNTLYDEFCIYDESHVVVLWLLKLA